VAQRVYFAMSGEPPMLASADVRLLGRRTVHQPTYRDGKQPPSLSASWNEFLYALVLTSGGTQTAPVTIAGFLSFFGTNWARLTAAGVIGALPIVVFAILVRKHMARGLSFGGVK
jgi:hypothetical protein